jgi:aspartate aminotransferase
MAEQKAVARYLMDMQDIDNYLSRFRAALQERLVRLHEGIQRMKAKGLRVDSIAPQAAIYLTLCINVSGMLTKNGSRLNNQNDVTAYLLHRARLALVPFHAFGDDAASPWYRLSVGTCRLEEIDDMLSLLEEALLELHQ